MVQGSLLAAFLIVGSTIFVAYQLYKALGRSKLFVLIVVIWSIITAVLGLSGFYLEPAAVPPRFFFLVAPGVGITFFLLLTAKGRKLLDNVNLADLTLMQTVRFPVEIVLYMLFAASLVPQLMTFEGFNFDIITGLTAPLVFYLVFKTTLTGSRLLLLWNFLGIGLLLTIMSIAILSSPTPFQKLAFEQPNVGVTYFPFVWLPGIIVPAALFAHVASLRQLLLYPKRELKKPLTHSNVKTAI